MAQYKLIYFNLRARGEIARLIFNAAGQKFEDYRVEGEQWPQFKANTPFGALPVLEVTQNGKTTQIAQSLAIARFLGRKFDLYGKTDVEMAQVDMYADQLSDFSNELVKVHQEADKDRKKQAAARLAKEIVPTYLKQFESKLARSSSGFIIGDSLTWADLYLISKLEWLGPKREAVIANFPKIKAHDEKIRNIPRIAEWLAKRPVTEL